MADNRSILVTDFADEFLIEGLKNLGHVDYQPSIMPNDVEQIIDSYWGIIINSKIRVDHDFLQKANKLNWIGRLGSGLDVIDLEAAKEHGVHVINSPEGNANAVGEHALAMLLALLNKIPHCDEMVRRLEPWDRESMRGKELDGMKVGVIGCGHTGSAFVKKLNGFDVEVYIFDKYREHIPTLHRFQKESNLEELLQHCDIISLHLPLTDETRALVNMDFINQLADSSILINTSRGGIVRLTDVADSLESGKLAGVCLDVFENEKPSKYSEQEKQTMSRLAKLSQVVMSPHVAGWTIESKQKIARILLEKIICVVSGESNV